MSLLPGGFALPLVRRWSLLAMLAASVTPTGAAAHDVYVYPAKGQSAAQQDNDEYHCYRWAKDQTGFDPSASVAAPPPRSNALRGAAGGAALGAVGGAIGGDAGKGAAIGAGVGAVIGGVRRRKQEQAYASAVASGRDTYNRAFAACMTGKGYTVR
jgi:Glycine-zipper domain